MMNPETLAVCQNTFGHGQTNGIVTILGEWFTPFLADLIIRWLLTKNWPSGATSGLISTALVRRWLAQTLRENKEEILAFINQHVSSIFDVAINALEGL